MSGARLPELRRVVPADLAGQALDRVLRTLVPGASWSRIRTAVARGKVRVAGQLCTEPAILVAAGTLIEIVPSAPRPSSSHRISPEHVLYVDRHLVVVRKPPGISTVPFHPGERGSLVDLVRAFLSRRGPRGRAESTLGVVQRLDRESSGLLVFARNLAAKRHLEQQFRRHSVERRYLALVPGRIEEKTLRSRLVKDRGDGRRGSTLHPELGQVAVTHVRPIEFLPAATLVECRLETGRTHQIRIQLAEAGHPLYGERVYARRDDRRRPGAPRLMLHAAVLGLVHPTTGEQLRFTEPLPPDMLAELERHRAGLAER
jgi:23S rRNA pseudouridine1911/1915/1917 synthase